MDQEKIRFIADLLNRTISANSEDIKRAEDELVECSKTRGYAEILLVILRDPAVPEQTRLSASVALKNFIRNNWNPDSGFAVAPLEEDERTIQREQILQAMFELGGAYRRQLSQCVCLIGKYDFPAKWPNLVELLASQLSAPDFDRIDAALTTIEELVRRYRYEMKSVELFKEIQIVLDCAAPQITALYARMLEFLPEGGDAPTLNLTDIPQWLEILLMLVKCYYSLVWQDFPAYFEDHLQIWLNGFIRLLRMQIPDNHADDNDASAFDNVRRVICNVFRLFAQRYEEDFMPHIPTTIQTVWELLVQTDQRLRFDSMVNSALGFLSAVSEKERYAEIFNQPGALENICNQIIIKNLTLRREDLEQFEDEPFEYLKRDIEGLDTETRRRGAADFVRALTKHFEARVFEILLVSINSYLAEYSQNPTTEWVRKDAVYFLVSALASKAVTVRHGATATSQLINVGDFYNSQVRNDLFNIDVNTYPPILVADALNFVVLFRNHLQADTIMEIFSGPQAPALRMLASQRRILHHYLGYTFDKIFTTKRDNVSLFNSERIPVQAYIEAFSQALQTEDAQKSHYLVKALLRCFSIMDNTTAKNANTYMEFLIRLVEAVVKESQSPIFTHMVFECLCVVIKKAFPFIQASINSHVMPIIEAIIERDMIDFVPYALQIVALLLYQVDVEQRLGRPVENAKKYEDFFPHLLTGKFWHRPVNAPALLSIFEAFVRTSPQLVLQPQNINAVMGLYQKMINERTWDEHGFRLATTLLPHYDTNDVLTARNILFPMLNRLQTSKTIRFTRSFVMFLCRFAYLIGGKKLAEALDGIQSGMYGMVVDKVIITELSSPVARNNDDKKKLIVGLVAMIEDAGSLQGPLYGRVVEIAKSVLDSTSIRPLDEDEEVNEAEYADPFCKLGNLQAEEDVAAEQRVKRDFDRAVDILRQIA